MRWPHFLAALLFACSGSDLAFEGELGQPALAVRFTNLFLVPTTIDDAAGPHLIVDTGAPINIIAPGTLPDPPRSGDVSVKLRNVDVLSLSFPRLPILAADFLSGSIGNGITLGGVLGCSVLCDFAVTFDYRAGTVTLDGTEDVEGLETPTEISFFLKGGGAASLGAGGAIVSLPRSRILVDAIVEGVPATLVLDSGASVTMLRSALANEISPNRVTIDGPIVSMLGSSTIELMRVADIALDETVAEGIVVGKGGLDSLLDQLGDEIGQTVDGILGASFLQEFHTTVDYPARTVRFARYESRDHVLDVGRTVGFRIDAAGSAGFAEITEVFDGTDAADQGLTTDDTILAIDEISVEDLTADDLDALLSGADASSHEIDFGCPDGLAEFCGTSFVGVRTIRADYDRLPIN